MIINTRLMRQPLNWFTVALMAYIAAIAVHLVLTHYSQVVTGSDLRNN